MHLPTLLTSLTSRASSPSRRPSITSDATAHSDAGLTHHLPHRSPATSSTSASASPRPSASKAAKLCSALAISGLALTACSGGSSTDPAAGGGDAGASRIASVGLGDADTLLALGVTPVAVAPWGAEGDVDPSGVGPWSRELLGDAKPEKIFNTTGGFGKEVLEKITLTQPDKIIAVNQAVDAQAKAELGKIAPVVTKPEGFADWQVPWDKQVETIADAVDREAKGDELIGRTRQAFADFKASHPDLQGKKAAIVMPYEGKLGLYTAGDGRGQFIQDLGFSIPKDLQGDGSSFFVDYSPENYNKLESVDYLFVLDYNGAVDALKRDRTFQNLSVVRDGKVRYLDTDTGNAMSMPNPVTIPWAVKKFAEQL